MTKRSLRPNTTFSFTGDFMNHQNLDISKLSKANKRTFILLQQSFPNIQNNPILTIGHILDLFQALPEYQPHFNLLKGSRIFKHVKDGNLNEKKEWLTLVLHLIDRDPKLSQQYHYDIDELRKIGLLLSYLSDYDLFPIQIKGKEYSLDDISLLGSCLCTESFLSPSLMETEKAFFSQFELNFDMKSSHFMTFLSLDKWIELAKTFHTKRKSSSARLSKAINVFDEDDFFDQNIFAEFSTKEITDYLFSKDFNDKTASLLILALPKSLRSEAILDEINKHGRPKLEKRVIALLENILESENFELNDKLFSTLLSFISDKERFTHYFEKLILQYLKKQEKIEKTYAINLLFFNSDDYFHFNPHWKNDIDFSFIANVENNTLFAKIVLKLAESLPVNESLFHVLGKRKLSLYTGVNKNKIFHFHLFKSHNGKRIFDYFTPLDKLFFLKDYFPVFDRLFSFDEINQLKIEDLDYIKSLTSKQYWVKLCEKIDPVDLMKFFRELQKTTCALKIIEKTGNKALWEKAILSYAKLGELRQFEAIQWLYSVYVDKKDDHDPFLLDLIDKCLE